MDVYYESFQFYIKTAAKVLNENGITKQFLEQYDVTPMDVIVHSITGENELLENAPVGDIYSEILETCEREFPALSLDDSYDVLNSYSFDDEYIYTVENFGEISKNEMNKYIDNQKEDNRGFAIWYYVDRTDLTIFAATDILWYGQNATDWQIDDRLSDDIYKLLKD